MRLRAGSRQRAASEDALERLRQPLDRRFVVYRGAVVPVDVQSAVGDPGIDLEQVAAQVVRSVAVVGIDGDHAQPCIVARLVAPRALEQEHGLRPRNAGHLGTHRGVAVQMAQQAERVPVQRRTQRVGRLPHLAFEVGRRGERDRRQRREPSD